jgi:hypothetical protein
VPYYVFNHVDVKCSSPICVSLNTDSLFSVVVVILSLYSAATQIPVRDRPKPGPNSEPTCGDVAAQMKTTQPTTLISLVMKKSGQMGSFGRLDYPTKTTQISFCK